MERTIFGVSLYKITLYIIIISIFVFLLHRAEITLNPSQFFSQSNLEAIIKSAGPYSWLIYTFFVFIVSLSPLPSSALGLVAGYLFTPFWAIALTLVGEMMGAITNFFIGKKIIGKHIVQGRFPNVSKWINKYQGNLSPLTIFILGMIPAGTTNVTAYAAGLSGIKLKNYLWPWAGGITVLSVLTAYLGHSAKINSTHLTIIIIGAIILLVAITKILPRFIKNKNIPVIK